MFYIKGATMDGSPDIYVFHNNNRTFFRGNGRLFFRGLITITNRIAKTKTG